MLRGELFHPQQIRKCQLKLHLERCIKAEAVFNTVLQYSELGLREGVEAGSEESSTKDKINCEVVLLSTSTKLSIPFRVIDVVDL